MADSWVRLWAGMTTDPKWKTISRKSGRPVAEVIAVFTHALMLANESEERGHLYDTWVTEDVASALDIEEEHVEAIRKAMEGRVIEGDYLTGWENRQVFKEDSGNTKTGAKSSAERKREQREREKQSQNSADVTTCHDVSRDVTTCHAPEAEAEAEAEVNQTHTPNPLTASDPPDGGVCFSIHPPAITPSPPTTVGAICQALRVFGISGINHNTPKLTALMAAGADLAEFLGAAQVAKDAGKPSFGYLLGIMIRQREEVKTLSLHQGPLPNARDSPRRQTPQEKRAETVAALTRQGPRNAPNIAEPRDITHEVVRIA